MKDNVFSGGYETSVRLLDDELRMKESFDLVGRTISVGSRRARFYFVDGLIKDETMVKIMQYMMSATDEDLKPLKTTRDFANRYVSYVETDVVTDLNSFVTFVLSGTVGLIVEGYSEAMLIDTRTYPVRSVDEPENDKVLRGSHDGFVETVIFNTAMIRRRIRSTKLTMEYKSVGSVSKSDIVLCYIDGKIDKKLLDSVRQRIDSIKVKSLTMGQETLAESLCRKQRFNPFPKIRYTERPDAAAASINEGSLVILTDNSPSAMIIPTGVFDFLQDSNDYYFPPLIGSYLRIIRMIVFALTLLLTPVWYLLIQNPESIPPWLSFILIEEPNSVPVIAQLLIIEIVIDALKLASLNTPSALSNSFSIVGALVLGEFAVQAGWIVSEVVLYMAFVAIANFAQPSYELGYAFKLCRMMLLILIALFNIWGFIAGIILIIVMIAFNKTVTGRCYLYPLIPFNGKALSSLLIRKPLSSRNN